MACCSQFAFQFKPININIHKCMSLKSITVHAGTTTLSCEVRSGRKDELLAVWGVNNYFPI